MKLHAALLVAVPVIVTISDAVSHGVGETAVWVVNDGDGTVTRIEP